MKWRAVLNVRPQGLSCHAHQRAVSYFQNPGRYPSVWFVASPQTKLQIIVRQCLRTFSIKLIQGDRLHWLSNKTPHEGEILLDRQFPQGAISLAGKLQHDLPPHRGGPRSWTRRGGKDV